MPLDQILEEDKQGQPRFFLGVIRHLHKQNFAENVRKINSALNFAENSKKNDGVLTPATNAFLNVWTTVQWRQARKHANSHLLSLQKG